MYGESAGLAPSAPAAAGLSPRVRGIHVESGPGNTWKGSIPACTGNPCRHIISGVRYRVYPRVYGESCPWSISGSTAQGLSPRVRGIPDRRYHRLVVGGSIPACTGNPLGQCEPVVFICQRPMAWAYGDSPAMRRIRCHTSRASDKARCLRTGGSMHSTSQAVASEA